MSNLHHSLFSLQVIVRRDGKIQLLCKGADTTVNARLEKASAEILELTNEHLNVGVYVIINELCTWLLAINTSSTSFRLGMEWNEQVLM